MRVAVALLTAAVLLPQPVGGRKKGKLKLVAAGGRDVIPAHLLGSPPPSSSGAAGVPSSWSDEPLFGGSDRPITEGRGIPAHLLSGSGAQPPVADPSRPRPGAPFSADDPTGQHWSRQMRPGNAVFDTDDPIGARATELAAKSERAARVCGAFATSDWGDAAVRAEARGVMEDLDKFHEGQLGNLRCLSTLYELLGEHSKLINAMIWQLDQPWCCPSDALDPPGSKVPCRCCKLRKRLRHNFIRRDAADCDIA